MMSLLDNLGYAVTNAIVPNRARYHYEQTLWNKGYWMCPIWNKETVYSRMMDMKAELKDPIVPTHGNIKVMSDYEISEMVFNVITRRHTMMGKETCTYHEWSAMFRLMKKNK